MEVSDKYRKRQKTIDRCFNALCRDVIDVSPITIKKALNNEGGPSEQKLKVRLAREFYDIFIKELDEIYLTVYSKRHKNLQKRIKSNDKRYK
ncbi:MAG: hypothetical protein F6K19_01755 [Cyanothece sp. SIO1E1]|nr:hypothetical protein [Cyanothece sp. SIO1E1]